VIGDGLWAQPALGVQVEHLHDDRRLVGVGLKAYALLGAVAEVALGHRLGGAAVAVGRSTAHAQPLLGGLPHSALGLAGELVALELVEDLLEADHHPALGGGRVAAAGGVVDGDADLAKLALEERRVDAVARQARRVVDHDGVEPSGLAVGGLGH
jgi:hypothetical protein